MSIVRPMRSSIKNGKCLQHTSRNLHITGVQSRVGSSLSLRIPVCRLHTTASHQDQPPSAKSFNSSLRTGPYARVNSALKNTAPARAYMERNIRDLKEDDLGKYVAIHGFCKAIRKGSTKFGFFEVLNEGSRLTCIHKIVPGTVVNQSYQNMQPMSPIKVYGQFRHKQDGRPHQGRPFLASTEIDVESLDVLNSGSEVLVTPGTVIPMRLRHLQIRTDNGLMEALRLRAKVASLCRNFLEKQNFMEVETPLLYKSTPEGAREFIVPTRTPEMVYALPQSPQQYKQILMASGINRYYQIAKCFRDEDLRADRQPEFTQLDMEMSFVSGTKVMQVMEALIQHIWREVLGIDIGKIPTMTYHQAISKYGSDKPDTRFGYEIHDVTKFFGKSSDYVYEIFSTGPLTYVPSGKSSDTRPPVSIRDIHKRLLGPDSFETSAVHREPGGPSHDFVMVHVNAGYFHKVKGLVALCPEYDSDFPAAEAALRRIEAAAKLELGCTYVMMRRPKQFVPGASTPIGDMRKKLYQLAVKNHWIPEQEQRSSGFKFLWVTDFPLFSPATDPKDPGQGGVAGYKATHHPFTAPAPQDEELFLSEPLKCLGAHYDLVVNGCEIGGGSTRIHEADIQEYVFQDVLKIPKERLETFDKFLSILRSGCPPHAGMALGFDRVIALLHGTNSIRDVIAFPKSASGSDMTVGSPAKVSREVLSGYHLRPLSDTSHVSPPLDSETFEAPSSSVEDGDEVKKEEEREERSA